MDAVPPQYPPPAPPASPLNYSYAQHGRPGLVTAIGVISIIVASLGILTALFEGLCVTGLYIETAQRASARRPSPSPPPGGPTGLPAAQCDAALSAMAAMQPMNAAQSAELRTLLASSGRTVFPGLSSSDPAGDVRALVASSSAVPAANASTSPSVYFTMPSGYIYVYDRYAAFTPVGQSPIIYSYHNSTGPRLRLPRYASPALFVGALALCGCNLGLAVYLLVIAIITLLHSPRGARLHRMYALMKIPACVAGTAALAAFIVPAMGAPTAVNWRLGAFFVALAALGLAYPVGLLLALRSAGVRAYYQSVRP